MFSRLLKKQLIQAAGFYPIVTLTGPRQSGKTTLVISSFPEHEYLNLEDPETLEKIQLDPKKFLNDLSGNVILDEIQNFPKLLSYIQVYVDKHQKKGQFILTGSHQLSLMEAISQSLAGRTDLLVLYPLSLSEILQSVTEFTLESWLFKGFYPRLYSDAIPPERAYKNYLQTYVERDVRRMIHIKDLSAFQKLLKLCAGRIGQVLNIQNLCNETGISHNTLRAWLSVLEASYLIRLLPPFYKNFGKRVLKSPKLYFVDVGLACYLLGIREMEQLDTHPLRGMLFENLVVMDCIKHQTNRGLNAEFYYYRDNNQHEVDLLYERGNQLIPIEIKSSQTFNRVFLKGIEYFQKLTTPKNPGYLIYAGEGFSGTESISIVNYTELERVFS